MDKKTTKTTTVKRSVSKRSPRIHETKRSAAKKSGGGSLDSGPNKPKK
jgi:hypothetical protein